MSNPVYNFCAGPAALPRPVMQQAQQELLDWQGLGISVMEISHRSSEYQQLAQKADADLRQLLNISDDYAVLFMHGGASLQFANIAMALLGEGGTGEYLCNGIWSDKAEKEAERFGRVHRVDVLTSDSSSNKKIALPSDWHRADSPVYTHYTPNETIEGMRFPSQVETTGALVADMSSSILSEQIAIDQFDFIYAGAQKNIGPAGMTIVIAKRELINKMHFAGVPKVFDYQRQSAQGSMVNTPPTFAWYLASLVFDWLLKSGGVSWAESQAKQKAQLVYDCIDQDDYYRNPVAIENRSRMNIPFILADQTLDAEFLAQAKQAGLVGLKGHRSVGGMRASLYNSMPFQGAEALVDFMHDFKQRHG